MKYTTYNANLNSADYRSTYTPNWPIAKQMQYLRRSIAAIKAAGGNPATYETALATLRCPTCANEGGCPDCGAE